MKSIIAQIDRRTGNIMAAAFIGIHIPMMSVVLYGIFNTFIGLGPLVLTIIVATMFSTVATILFIFRIFREIETEGAAA
ncbi:hypothetical protein AL073_18240 [Loktanella sp. 1ANDIMAR09]|nr:hypothetical protein AL073_18240 [Loktanella sp. 1ANDIMAR09]